MTGAAWAQAPAAAPEKNPVDTGDTAFMLISAALGAAHDSGTRLFLRWISAIAQRSQHHDDELGADGDRGGHLGALGL